MTTNDPARAEHASLIVDLRGHTRSFLAQIGLRVARSLAPGDGEAFASALAFTARFAQEAGVACDPLPAIHPLTRLESIAPSPAAARRLHELLGLACLPEAHEGFGTLFRLVHPQGAARPTVALALHWLESESDPSRTVAFSLR